jgi:hypothetical protein
LIKGVSLMGKIIKLIKQDLRKRGFNPLFPMLLNTSATLVDLDG